MRFIKQILRGLQNLPYEGEHPGTVPLAVILVTGSAFLPLGLLWIMTGVLVPTYLLEAYVRAERSDIASRKALELPSEG